MRDAWIAGFDRALRVVAGRVSPGRPLPEGAAAEVTLTRTEARHAAGLMRVNHVGEVCAQALYQGQAITSRDPALAQAMRKAAAEEIDHLHWTRHRLDALGERPSRLNGLWYMGALGLGVLAGCLGDRWNLGLLAETERQVEAHLVGHLGRLPAADTASRVVVEQMRRDEAEHARMAEMMGAAPLPVPVRLAMCGMAKVMTTVAYRL